MILVLHLQLHCWKHINISGKDYSGIFTWSSSSCTGMQE
jgi:hypothetical protein